MRLFVLPLLVLFSVPAFSLDKFCYNEYCLGDSFNFDESDFTRDISPSEVDECVNYVVFTQGEEYKKLTQLKVEILPETLKLGKIIYINRKTWTGTDGFSEGEFLATLKNIYKAAIRKFGEADEVNKHNSGHIDGLVYKGEDKQLFVFGTYDENNYATDEEDTKNIMLMQAYSMQTIDSQIDKACKMKDLLD